MIGNGERVAVAAVAELELTFEVGTPQIIRRNATGEGRAGGAMPRAAETFDQAVAVQDRMDSAVRTGDMGNRSYLPPASA